MKFFEADFGVSTQSRNQMVDVTGEVKAVIRDSGISNGDVIVYCPHTTAAITINENADKDVVHDILLTLSEIFPEGRGGYRHMEGNSDSHVKSSLVGCSEQIILTNGGLSLGTWQGIFFCEFDGPRSRRVKVQVRGE